MGALNCQSPHTFVMFIAKLFCIFCIIISDASCAEEVGKIQANPALAAEMRQRDMLKASVEPFFKVNNDFLNIVQMNYLNGPLLTNLISNITDQKHRTFNNIIDIARPIVVTYPGYVALFLFGLLLFLVIPIVGIFWCLCRCCCNRCGARAKPMDGKYARCRRGTFGVILGILCTLVLAGSVLAFISNDLLHRPFMVQSPDNPVTKFNSSLIKIVDNLDTILRNFNNQTLLLLGKQVPKVRDAVRTASLEAQTSTITKSKVSDIYARWDGLQTLLQTYDNASRTIITHHALLSEANSNLTSEFYNLTDNLKSSFNSCSTAECRSALETLNTLNITFQLSNVDMTPVNHSQKAVSTVNNTALSSYLSFVNNTLNDISVKITTIGRSEIDTVIANLNDSKKIEAYFANSEVFIKNITTAFRAFTGILNNQTVNGKKIKPFLAEVDTYRMYGYIVVASTVLLIVFFYYLGLCFGACGEPPYEDARFCNRGAGSTLMSCGVGFTFLFFPIVMLVTMVLFMTGAPIRTEACRYLLGDMPNGYNILDSEMSHIVNSMNFSFSPGFPFPPNITYHIMGDCNNDTSIITAFSLEDLINGAMIYNTEVRPSLVNLQQTVQGVDLNINLERFTTDLGSFIDVIQGQNIIEARFQPSIAELQKVVVNNWTTFLARAIAADASMPPPPTNDTSDVNVTLTTLTELVNAVNTQKSILLPSFESLKPIGKLQGDAAVLSGKLSNFQINMKTRGTFLTDVIKKAFNNLETTVKEILINAVTQVLNQYASCRVLHQQVTELVNLVCVDILNPFNGFWLGIGWCLLILIPSMIFACKLNYLYKKTEYYVKDYEEPDYMSYQGFYPSDNIPLERTSSGLKLLGASKSEHYA